MSKLTRRDFTAAVGGMALLGILDAVATSAMAAGLDPQALLLKPNGWVPNNSRLPVLHYRNVLSASDSETTAQLLEAAFNSNGWPPQWRNGVYSYHHYHSTAHEVLGFAAGRTRVMIGGPNGHELEVNAGDVVVLPAGTGHCRIDATSNYLVIGAYPPGQSFDICREAPTAAMTRVMQGLTFPSSDPVGGRAGALPRLWKSNARA